MKLKDNKQHIFFYLIIFISFIYSFLTGSGFYGYNIDYYSFYNLPDSTFTTFDILGGILSSLTIFNFNIGVYLTSFFLSLSLGILIKSFFSIKKAKSSILFIIIYIAFLHSHPIIMSTSGAMRQGWAMSFIFFSISMYINYNYTKSKFFIFIAIFLHKSGIFFFLIYLFSLVINKYIKKKKFIFIFSFFLIFLIILIFDHLIQFLIPLNLIPSLTSRIVIANDMRFYWLLLNSFYLIFYFFLPKSNFNNPLNFLSIFLFFLYIFFIIILFFGFNDQYERLNMMTAIFYFFLVTSFLTKQYFYFFILMISFMYLYLTIMLGMYSVGLY